ncbi:hypothetical protein NX794_33535 [Streptomyces sp. LP11]|uniref:Membrane-bound hydrophilic protein n=1 Tax=Streptomyces pyxinicus TaxID=2970331 RepID=A0ABT2BC59_9ACTN|nr:hypothetical protein [Streptomyces sp. LP11]MCS0606097.1 hypothetical protein [Streptomyces sp. LP11]
MPADEVTRGADVNGSRARTGPRHAAPRKPLFTRFHMPAGKAIASVAMPTAVIVGMGFTSTLALADNSGTPSPTTSAKSLTADEYKDCVKALDDSKDGKDDKDPSDSPSPSASESTSETATPSEGTEKAETAEKDDKSGKQDTKGSGDSDQPSPSDSGSDDEVTPKPSPSAGSGSSESTPSPSPSRSSGGLLDTIGDTIGDILTGGKKHSDTSTTPTPTASASADDNTASSGSKASDPVKDTASKAGKTVEDTVKNTTDTAKNTTDTAKKTTDDASKTADDATASATSSPSPTPSASESDAAKDCPKATDAEGGVDNKVLVADDPWYLNASSLLLKAADYQGVVEVKTAGGTTKKVLKYVISGGTDIGDLHQTVKDKQAGKTYHVQASKGSSSKITGGDTVMYTESISGNLFGLIPVTFSPDSPPPLNIPLIYFTNVKVVQAAQFGGNLTIPGMHVYTTD